MLYWLCLCTLLLLSLTVQKLKAECQFNGKLYMNHTLWLPNHCTICTCLDPVSVCEAVRCLSPQCQFTRGEYLQIPSDGCCPECVQHLSPCQYQSQTKPHNTDWNPEPCSRCLCWDGIVTCSAVVCPEPRCKPGEVSQTLPGQCCPQCIPAGRSCLYDDQRHEDGEEWSPLPCTKCICRDSQTSCYPVQCPPLVCPQGQTIGRQPDSCCPVCLGASCTYGNKQYKNGEQWQKNPCTFCMCIQGQTVCREKECVDPKDMECNKNEMKVRRDGECCPECVSAGDNCEAEVPVRYNGDIWNVSACEYCACEQGGVQCKTATCEPLVCEKYEKKVHLDGKCCPECVEPPKCDFAGEMYVDNDTWHPDPCTVCNCKSGEIVCYQTSCPVCVGGNVSVIQPGECCGTCQPLRCADACSKCLPQDMNYCTECKLPGLLLEEGKCVQKCRKGMYPNMAGKCSSCHESCASCIDETQYHCVTCKPGLLWRNGGCVARCGKGFFQENGQCIECDPTCSFCLGPEQNQCMSCSNPGHVLMHGLCLNSCGPSYYIRDRECIACQPTCQTCSSDGRFCTSCNGNLILHKGQCVSSCPEGLYSSPEGFCAACFPSCKSCTGPEDTACRTCKDSSRLSKRGRCRNPCPAGQYQKSNGECQGCDIGCSKCHSADGGSTSVCLECNAPQLVAFDNICVRQCPIGHYSKDGICQGCGSGCVQCNSPAVCTRCGPSLLLNDGVCVQRCGQAQFTDDARNMCSDCTDNCLECSAMGECTQCNERSFLKDGICVSVCGKGYYQNIKTRKCDENRSPPVLQIYGQIRMKEGEISKIPADIFSLSDPDSPREELFLVLSRTPDNGELVKAKLGRDVTVQAGDKITLNDLDTGRVRFIHRFGSGPKSRIIFKASDNQLESKDKALYIQAVSKNPPRLLRHKSLLASSGNTTTLGVEQFDVRVTGLVEAVFITVIQGPSHGKIVNQEYRMPVSTFSLMDLRADKIGYQNDQNNAKTDLVLMQISDGYHLLNFLLHIDIRKKENVLPMLLQNSVGHVKKGDLLQLSPDLLKAKVMDEKNAPSDDIIFTLVPPVNNPKEGEIVMVVQMPNNGPGKGWEDMGNGKMSAKMFRFLQRDIDEGRIWYKHKGAVSSNDAVMFEISDTSDPPNILKDQAFHISIKDEEITTAVPTIAPGIRLGMTVLENQVVPISSTNLAFQDRDTPDSDIVYSIKRGLGHNDGTLEHVRSPFTSIHTFTQEDINNNRIIYRPPLREIGVKEKEVSFTFLVTDGSLDAAPPEQRFTIRVVPVNNMPPRFLNPNPAIQVSQGGSAPLGQSLLAISDPDTLSTDLSLTLTVSPTQGRIEKVEKSGRIILRKGDTFLYEELINNQFQYTHDKSNRELRDVFELQVSDGSHQSTARVNVTVIRVDKSAPILMPTATCRVTVKEGETAVLMQEDLGFMDDDEDDARLNILLSSLPVHGKLMFKQHAQIRMGQFFQQKDINAGFISYKADQEIGSQPITEILVFNVSDNSNNVLPNQVLSVVIQPVDNQAPVVKVGPAVSVEEGGQVALGVTNIKVTDIDSHVSSLHIVLEKPPSFGEIVSTKPEISDTEDLRPHSVTTFSVQDLIDGHIYYEQTDHKNKEPAWDSFLFIVTDGTNKSPTQRFNISIQLVNDESPVLVTEQLFVKEDLSVLVTNASVYIIDLDTRPEDLIMSLDSLPSHGTLGRRDSIQDQLSNVRILKLGAKFTFQDILDELLVYRHMGGEITMDALSLSVTDGDYEDENTLNIIIGLVHDETPRMTINRGLRINAGTTSLIKSKDLRATDIDSNDPEIKYTIKRDPPAGSLILKKGNSGQRISHTGPISSFTQAAVDSNLLEYVHKQGEATGVVTFKFDVEDTDGNALIDQIFYITILEDRHFPELVSSKELIVAEGQQAKLTTEYLSFTDVDSEPGNLKYFLLSAPTLGHLELTKKPGVPISEFTQSDLAAGSLLYIHTSQKEEYEDSFTFTVTDGTNEVTRKFSITITPVDDQIPVVINNGLTVQEGVRKILTPFDLRAVDKDTKEDSLIFTVVHHTIHGSLDILQNNKNVPAATFTMANIYDNRISYQHDGSETSSDNFSFTVTDGSTSVFAMQRDGRRGEVSIPSSKPQNFEIKVIPSDDGSPVLKLNLGLQFLEQSADGVYNIITSRELLATDVDTDPDKLKYVVTRQPQYGHLENTANPSVQIQSFTQEDINNQVISYVLTGDLEMTQDSFTFDLVDSKPNRVPGNTFHIMWSVIRFEQPQINITETGGVVKIPVVRIGNLKQYSIATCRTTPGSATPGSSSTRPGSQDYMKNAGQVQFDEWQDLKVCNIIINDDSIFEGPESFTVELVQPVYVLVGKDNMATVTIYDKEDEPVLQFSQAIYHVNETDRLLSASLVRTGDVSTSASAICYTTPLTARGSSVHGLESGSDYITRTLGNTNRVVFPAGVTSATCEVKLVDDSEFESSEQFELVLSDPSVYSRLGSTSTAIVIIDGPNDESSIHLSLPEYHFDEDSGDVEVEVIRDGADLSHTSMVWCATRLSSPPSATPGQDYIPSTSQVTFGPGQTSEKCRLTILDDDVDPELEGNETFVVWLSSSMGSNIVRPYTASVTIHDGHLDVPSMEFGSAAYSVKEESGLVNVPIVRHGDVSCESSVVCYTRQDSAQVMMDYEERPLLNVSRVIFKKGEKVKNCTVGIVNDKQYEPDEAFYLRLKEPKGGNNCKARIGSVDKTTITITNPEDVSRLQFEQEAYTVHEPTSVEQMGLLTIRVIRSGDLSHTSSVRCSTRDGSAMSGVDYNPKSQILVFDTGVAHMNFTVNILYNSDIEWHEVFTVVFDNKDLQGAEMGDNSYTTITILDDEVSGSLVLPAQPVVVSLLHYDDVDVGMEADPSPGYPLVCVSPCDIHYPTYSITHSLCQETGINQSAIIYSWEVAMPTDGAGSRPPFVMVTDNTVYTSVDKKVLDSIYFRPSFRVRCIAQPLHPNGNPGIPSKSKEVKISHDNGICNAPVHRGTANSYGAQSFLSQLEYVGPDDPFHSNTIHISIKIPHQDGYLPLISTYPLHNLRFLLSDPIYRQQHLCSNLMTPEERAGIVQSGFLDSKDLYPTSYNFPYQFDPELRENKTISLYRHLDLKACLWRFDAWYHMSDLVDVCGGKVISDFQVRDAGQTYLTIKVPLYVFYVYATAPVGWGSLQHHTEMEFSFYYDTVLWRSGLETNGQIAGDLQVLKVLVGKDGKLVLDFKTQTKFRGLYVLKHHTMPDTRSRVVPPDGMSITFDLALLWGQQTFDSPHQLWRATSNFNLKDYTGRYIIELIPCTVKPTQIYTIQNGPVPCTAQQPQRFEVPIAFQQSNRPVPLVYSLDTDFQLTSSREVFLMNPKDQNRMEDVDYERTFSRGQKVYGRVLWNPEQDLKSAYKMSIEKVYLCTGSNGFVPTYDPQGDVYGEGPQFGCIQPSIRLLYRFLILDRGNPDVIQTHFQNIPFEAMFASDSQDFGTLEEMHGVDGFVMNVDPLYKVTSGNQWYLQVIYVISKAGSSRHRYLSKRSAVISVKKRDVNSGQNFFGVSEDDEETNGTNIIYLPLEYSKVATDSSSTSHSSSSPVVFVVPVIVIIILVLIVVIIVIYRRRRKRRKQKEDDDKNNVNVVEQNSLRYQNRRSITLSQSKISVNVTEIKDTTIDKIERDKGATVKIKDTNIRTQGKTRKTSGTEV